MGFVISRQFSAVTMLAMALGGGAVAARADAPPCPSDAFLDVDRTPGPGDGYPRPSLSVRCDGETLVVSSNAIPHYEFVQITPNPLAELQRDYRFTLRPKLAEEPSPLPLFGPMGVAINGIPLFGPNEGPVPAPGYGDPVFNQIMDTCMGHTARQYHYHALVESCLASGAKTGKPSPILGFADDGFPIFGPRGCVDEGCTSVVEFKSSWERRRSPEIDAWSAYRFVPKSGAEYLDRCNGHSGDDQGGTYHYHATSKWPYILGCFSGTPSGDSSTERGRRGPATEADPRPTRDQISQAAAELGIPAQELAEALGLAGGRVIPMNYATAARELGIGYRALSEALGVEVGMPAPRRGRRRGPPGQRGVRGQGPSPRDGARP